MKNTSRYPSPYHIAGLILPRPSHNSSILGTINRKKWKLHQQRAAVTPVDKPLSPAAHGKDVCVARIAAIASWWLVRVVDHPPNFLGNMCDAGKGVRQSSTHRATNARTSLRAGLLHCQEIHIRQTSGRGALFRDSRRASSPILAIGLRVGEPRAVAAAPASCDSSSRSISLTPTTNRMCSC